MHMLGGDFRPGIVLGDCLVPPSCLVHLLPRVGLDKSLVHGRLFRDNLQHLQWRIHSLQEIHAEYSYAY